MRLLRDRPAAHVALLAALAVAAAPSLARAGDLEDFQAARRAFQEHRYTDAVQAFEAMVGGAVPRVRSHALLVESRKYLGAAYLFANRRAEAETQFEALLTDDPEARLDAETFAYEVLQVFRAVQERVAARRAAAQDAMHRLDAEARTHRRELLVQLIALAQTEVEVRHQPLLAWLPFGVGQFQNQNEGLGWFFLTSELGVMALGGAAGITAISVPSSEMSLYQTMNYVTYLAAGALVVLIVLGIVEANVNYVPSHRERSRELPPELLDPDLLLGAGSLGIGWRF